MDGSYTRHVHFFKDMPLVRSVDNFCDVLGTCTAENKEAILTAAMAKEERLQREGEVKFELVMSNAAFEGSKVVISLFKASGAMNVYGKVVNVMVRVKPQLDVSKAKICYRFKQRNAGFSEGLGCVGFHDLEETRLLNGEMQLASSWLVVRGSVSPSSNGNEMVTRRLRLGIPEGLEVNQVALLEVDLRLEDMVRGKAVFEVIKRGPDVCNSFFKTCGMASYKPFESCHVNKIEEIYEAFFGLKSNGVFVEMGSYDGEQVFPHRKCTLWTVMLPSDVGHSWSNTAFLADIGWNGLYFDPIPEHVILTEARHWDNNVTVFETALGNETKDITIDVVSYCVHRTTLLCLHTNTIDVPLVSSTSTTPTNLYRKGGPITTADNDYRAKYQDGSIDWTAGFFQGDRRQVRQRLLPNLLRRFNIPRNFDLLIVDVEGMEFQVKLQLPIILGEVNHNHFLGYVQQILSTLNLTEFAPRMAIIELQDEHPSFDSLSAKAEECRLIRKQFADHGYVELFRDEVNTIFARYD